MREDVTMDVTEALARFVEVLDNEEIHYQYEQDYRSYRMSFSDYDDEEWEYEQSPEPVKPVPQPVYGCGGFKKILC